MAGKTGTSSEAVDGWFAGYGGGIVAVSWMGYDDSKSLGGKEFGATVALPIWIDYMKVAMKGRPPQDRPVPAGMTQVGGEWLYDEFTGDAARTTLDIEETAPGAENIVPMSTGAENIAPVPPPRGQ
jgi:penicillin-binding protein 1A